MSLKYHPGIFVNSLRRTILGFFQELSQKFYWRDLQAAFHKDTPRNIFGSFTSIPLQIIAGFFHELLKLSQVSFLRKKKVFSSIHSGLHATWMEIYTTFYSNGKKLLIIDNKVLKIGRMSTPFLTQPITFEQFSTLLLLSALHSTELSSELYRSLLSQSKYSQTQKFQQKSSYRFKETRTNLVQIAVNQFTGLFTGVLDSSQRPLQK